MHSFLEHSLLGALKTGIGWRDIVEIVILSYIIYRLLLFMKATRAIQVLKGIAVLIILAFLSRLAELEIIDQIIRWILGIGAIGIIVVFQPELRRALGRVGKGPPFHLPVLQERVIEEVVKSISLLASERHGALVVLERETGLEDLIETGVKMSSELSSELLDTIFVPQGALHDGAVVIRQGRVAAAACIISLDESSREVKTMGTRHLAAVSLSHDTDAIVIVVSEETGEVSIAINGEMKRGFDRVSLRNALRSIYFAGRKHWWAKRGGLVSTFSNRTECL